MTLEYLQSYVGKPMRVGDHVVGGETYQREVGGLVAWGWSDRISNQRGWWCAVTLADVVLEVAWTIGGASQRNEELRGMVARHQQPAQVSA